MFQRIELSIPKFKKIIYYFSTKIFLYLEGWNFLASSPKFSQDFWMTADQVLKQKNLQYSRMAPD